MNCNINYKQAKVIPVIFHILKHYDDHHLMTELGKFTDYSIDVIVNTIEKYSLTIKKTRLSHQTSLPGLMSVFAHAP